MSSLCHEKKRMNISLVPSISMANRINNLPDPILCHILSFLPTKEAATTSVLSKSWESMWLSVLALDFDYETFKNFNSFRNFLNSTFALRDKNVSILSFNFKCGRSSCFTQNQYDGILKKVMRVEILNFNMSNKKRITNLPPHIFRFKMLQVLKLAKIQVGDFDQVDFPHLKTLHLNNVRFKSDKYIVKFLHGCPILEILQSEIYSSGKMNSIIENVNALPNLVKVSIFGWNTPLALVCKTKILHLKKVMRMNLTNLPKFQNLIEIEVRFESLQSFTTECTGLLGILPHVPKLQHFYVQNCLNYYWKDPSVVSECLSLQLKTFCIRGYKDTKYEFGLAKYILQHSKVLKTMTIKSGYLSKHQMQLKLSSYIKALKHVNFYFIDDDN